MQSSGQLSILVNGSADLFVQERIRQAERDALAQIARGNRPSRFALIRYSIGQFTVAFGRRIAGRPRATARQIDVPNAINLAR
jgi:hypothetical protein